MHDAAKGIVLHLDQKVQVVGHQTIGVEIERQIRFLPPENIGEPEIVVVGAEYLSAIIAASDNVIKPSADFDPWFARHGKAEFIATADQMSTK